MTPGLLHCSSQAINQSDYVQILLHYSILTSDQSDHLISYAYNCSTSCHLFSSVNLSILMNIQLQVGFLSKNKIEGL